MLGGMAEWLKAAVLKTVEGNTSVGSNPTPSASFSVLVKSLISWMVTGNAIWMAHFTNQQFNQSTKNGEMAELAEGTRLLSE